MGNYRFRLSDMMPNSWFYKLRDMGRSSRGRSIKQHTPKRIQHQATTKEEAKFSRATPQAKQVYLPNRPSYYFTTRDQTEKPSISPLSHPKASDSHFPVVDPARKSMKKPRKRPTTPSPKHNHHSSISKPPHSDVSSLSSPSATDIIIEMNSKSSPKDEFSLHHLPRILTKPVRKEAGKKQQGTTHGIRVRPSSSSPKVEIKRVAQGGRRRRGLTSSRRLTESFVVVKRSADPQRDFRESMVEMIEEHHIRGSRDLEELLACYLTLNSSEYHDLIVRVFEEIWVDLTEIRKFEREWFNNK